MEQRPMSGRFRQIKFTNSKGFESSKLSSSKGFDPSKSITIEGMKEHMNIYNSQLFNPVTSENAFAATMKMDLIKIQEQINQLDMDKQIRKSMSSNLNKNHISVLKKWVNNNSQFDAKDIVELKVDTEIDPNQLMQTLNVKNAMDGLVKVYKILQVLETMISKMTELESVFFLKYNENFCNIANNKTVPANSKTNQLQQGISLSRFSVTQANLERQEELFDIINKNLQNNSQSKNIQKEATPDFSTISTVEEVLQSLEEHTLRIPQEESQLLQFVLNKENEKYMQLQANQLEMQQEIKQLRNQNMALQEKSDLLGRNQNVPKDEQYFVKVLDEMNENFNEDKKQMQEQVDIALQTNNQLQIKYDEILKEAKEYKDEYKEITVELRQLKDILNQKNKDYKDFADTYENVLQDEYNRMKEAYKTKILNINEEIINSKKKHAKEQHEMTTQLKKEQDIKRLLLKKLSIFVKI